MSTTINLDIPRTAEERLAREADSIWGLIKRVEARASDGRFYHLEDEDREKAIAYLRGYAKTHSKVLNDVREMSVPRESPDDFTTTPFTRQFKEDCQRLHEKLDASSSPLSSNTRGGE